MIDNTSLLQKKWVRHGSKILLLLSLWLVLTVWYIIVFDQSILVVSYTHHKSNFTHFTDKKLLRGESVSGEFMADDNNLGIVALRFQNFQRVPYEQEDSLLFRFKEKGQKQWYYENTYRSGFIYDLPLLPLGFPVIQNSIGKTYVFQLTSLKGTEKNGVALSDREPVLVSKYQENKKILLKDPKAFLAFAIKKFVNSFQTIDISFSSFVFLLPLLFYLVWNSSLKKFLPKYTLMTFLIGTILIDVLFLQIINDLLYITVPIIWLSLMLVYRFDSKYSYCVGIFFLLFSPVFLQLNNVGVSLQASSFAFVFFVLAFFQTLFEQRSA